MSAAIDLLDRMIDRTADLIDATGSEQLEGPTPCTRFSVGELLDHLVGWAHVFEAATNELDVSRDPTTYEVDSNRADAFGRAGHAAVAGLREGGVDRDMVMTTNPIPGTMVLDMMTMEYPGHGWDLAVATGQAYPFTDEEVEAAHRAAERMIQPPFRGLEEGQFRPVVDTPAGAPPVARYVAFLGRDPSWAP